MTKIQMYTCLPPLPQLGSLILGLHAASPSDPRLLRYRPKLFIIESVPGMTSDS